MSILSAAIRLTSASGKYRRLINHMKYLLMIYDDEQAFAKLPEAALQKRMGEYMQFTQDLKANGQLVAAERLQPVANATSVRVRDGKRMVTDGPFAETREQLGGFYLVEAKDLDEAIELAARIPSSVSGTIEVRPLFQMAAPARA